jgi:hypothetical protein
MLTINRKTSLAATAITAAAALGLMAAPAHASIPGVVEYTQCAPTQTNSNSAFPYTATTGTPPTALPSSTKCGNSFAWGFTVSGSATGQATWTGPNLGSSYSCTANAWIPDSHSNDPNAQYYVYTGSHYLANDAFVNQEGVTNNWTNVTNGTSFQLTSGPLVITLSDHNPNGQANLYEAAYAMWFVCSTSGS